MPTQSLGVDVAVLIDEVRVAQHQGVIGSQVLIALELGGCLEQVADALAQLLEVGGGVLRGLCGVAAGVVSCRLELLGIGRELVGLVGLLLGGIGLVLGPLGEPILGGGVSQGVLILGEQDVLRGGLAVLIVLGGLSLGGVSGFLRLAGGLLSCFLGLQGLLLLHLQGCLEFQGTLIGLGESFVDLGDHGVGRVGGLLGV